MDIATYLEAENLTPADLARGVNVSTQAAYRYARRERRPRPDIGQRIVEWSGRKISFEGIYGSPHPTEAA